MQKTFLVASVIGTRPEAIKMLPVIRALASYDSIRQRVICTGQHPAIADDFDLRGVEIDDLPHLAGGQAIGQARWRIRAMISAQLRRHRPDLLLVHGDTTSAIAGAFAARDTNIPLAHVEAGLRSFEWRAPWPEEGNRIAIDRMAHLLFAPTTDAATNLLSEPEAKGRIFVTGNTGIDALFAARDAAAASPSPERRLVVTCHRKENRSRIGSICQAVAAIADALPLSVTMVLHSNPAIRRPVEQALQGHKGIRLAEPMPHAGMVRLMLESWAILTDSGGLQEEGAALGRPVLVLRDVTERGEGIATDNIRLVGTDPANIVRQVAALVDQPDLYRRMSVPSSAFGDGRAAPRIAATILEWLDRARSQAALKASAISAKDHGHGQGMVPQQLETI